MIWDGRLLFARNKKTLNACWQANLIVFLFLLRSRNQEFMRKVSAKQTVELVRADLPNGLLVANR